MSRSRPAPQTLLAPGAPAAAGDRAVGGCLSHLDGKTGGHIGRTDRDGSQRHGAKTPATDEPCRSRSQGLGHPIVVAKHAPQAPLFGAPGCPSARGCQRGRRERPAAHRELKRKPAAERVPYEVSALHADRVHVALQRIGYCRRRRRRPYEILRATPVTQQRQNQHVVLSFERRQERRPRRGCPREPMDEHHRRTITGLVQKGSPHPQTLSDALRPQDSGPAYPPTAPVSQMRFLGFSRWSQRPQIEGTS